MYLYIIIGAIIVLYKEVFTLISHLIPLIYKGVVFVLKTIFIHSAKGAWYVTKKTHQVTYKKIYEIDSYMINQKWQK